MSIPVKKLSNGFELPVYGWGMGGQREHTPAQDKVEILRIQSAIELGVTHFDTAELYSDGHAEELLGSAIQGHDRSKLILATKAVSQHLTYDGVIRAVENSLRRLKTDYIDLYMMHRYPEPGMPIKDTMRALDELVGQGVVKNIGASNFSVQRFTEAQKHSKYKLVCNQVHYNVQYREVEAQGVLNFCQRNNVMLVAWRPLQQGTLSATPLLLKIASKYDKTPAQIALNWLVSQKNVVTVSKTNSIDHLKDNLGAFGWNLEIDDVERIRYAFPNQQFVSDLVPLDYPGSAPAKLRHIELQVSS